eukprot:9830324-Alexandrium_andersonii.AAC.1
MPRTSDAASELFGEFRRGGKSCCSEGPSRGDSASQRRALQPASFRNAARRRTQRNADSAAGHAT